MAKYKVTAATWNGHDEGFIVVDPDVRQEDLDVLTKIGVLELVVDAPVSAPAKAWEAPSTGTVVAGDGDLS